MQEEPYAIGTMAEIGTLARLEDGRMNLIAHGGQRFQIIGQQPKTYLQLLLEVVGVPFMRQMLSLSSLYRAGNLDRSQMN